MYPTFEKQLNTGDLALLLMHGYIPAPYSIWDNIYKLPASYYLVIDQDNSKPRLTCYWSFKEIVGNSDSNKFEITDKDAIKNLENLLTQSIKKQMLSDVPLVALISGGVNSSLVASLMQNISDTPIKTFSIGFEDLKFDESKHAEVVAKHLST